MGLTQKTMQKVEEQFIELAKLKDKDEKARFIDTL